MRQNNIEMLVHQKIRKLQSDYTARYRAGTLAQEKYDRAMYSLERELKKVEQKMYSVAYGDQLNLFKFISGTIPPTFAKIHARFPHLTWDQVITFEQCVRANGGSMMTHSGNYVLTHREVGDMDGYPLRDYKITWTCCHSVWKGSKYFDQDWPNEVYYHVKYDQDIRDGVYWCRVDRSTEVVRKRIGITQDYDGHWDIDKPMESPDLRNPNPIGRCDSPVLFSLVPDFHINNDMTVAELKIATMRRLDELEVEISQMRARVIESTELLKTLNLLTDS